MTTTNPTPVWKIANLERETATGKVATVHYTVDLTDASGTYNAGAYGSIGVDGELTVSFKDLTEDTVVRWVLDALGEEKVQEVRAVLEAQLESQRAPKVVSGVPWAGEDHQQEPDR